MHREHKDARGRERREARERRPRTGGCTHAQLTRSLCWCDGCRGRGDHLCSKCAMKLPRTQCHYCRTTYHLLARHSSLPPSQHLCTSCANDRELFGAPQLCTLCRFQAAFDGATLCRHCASDSKRFGTPLECMHCGFQCAFERDAESKAKVDGLTLCFLCTHQFKTIVRRHTRIAFGLHAARQLQLEFCSDTALLFRFCLLCSSSLCSACSTCAEEERRLSHGRRHAASCVLQARR